MRLSVQRYRGIQIGGRTEEDKMFIFAFYLSICLSTETYISDTFYFYLLEMRSDMIRVYEHRIDPIS